MKIERFQLLETPFTPEDVADGLCRTPSFRTVLLHLRGVYYRGISGASTTDPSVIERAEIIFTAEEGDDAGDCVATRTANELFDAIEQVIPRRAGTYKDVQCMRRNHRGDLVVSEGCVGDSCKHKHVPTMVTVPAGVGLTAIHDVIAALEAA